MKTRLEFERQLLHSGTIHWRMEPDEKNSLEYQLRQKPVTRKESLWHGEALTCWKQLGEGKISLAEDHSLCLETSPCADRWPEGSPDDGDYCTFGELEACLEAGRRDWQNYNRLHFFIYPDCEGMHSPLIALQLYNDGEEKIPDRYMREGYHSIHLRNHEWNECIWEFPSLPRDCVTGLHFIVHRFGKELSMSDTMRFCIRDIFLEYTPQVSHTLGWQCDEESIIFSTEGYWTDGKKTAVTSRSTNQLCLCRAEDGAMVYDCIPAPVENEKGSFYLWDFSDFTDEGVFYLKSEKSETKPFALSSHPLYQSVWEVLHFLYCERCGYPVGRGHGTCHGDIIAQHNGLKLAYQGGWHDAGDVSQQTLQTAEVTHALLEMAVRIKDAEPVLYYRLLEEAVWGLDFVLRMRFGDGYRATSAGIRRFSDGWIGSMDDCDARVHNYAFQNFMMSGVEAYAANALAAIDPPLADKAYAAACEDYRFAEERFLHHGMERYSFYEHSYNSALSLYWAAAGWAASLIYEVHKDSYFSERAVSYGAKMISCQETGGGNCPMSGFFYREPDHRTIVHFNHQSREQLYMQALEALCRNFPDHPSRPAWESSMRLYGSYLKKCFSFAAPYGMLPSGIHKMDEYQDRDTFPLLHLLTSFEDDSENYREQLQKGLRLNEDYCLRHFPVWFSFRGNTAIHLSSGKAASILGRYFGDEELLQIAREQIYWTFGKNPFGQSLVYGAGSNYAQQYGALNGEMVGSIPVGIETRGNEDVPFWPMENNATYKEVWTTSAGRWLWIAADLY